VIGRAWAALLRLLALTEPGTSLAAVRILVGACVVRTVLAVVWAGALPVVWVDLAHGGYRPLGEVGWLVAALGGATPAVVGGLAAASMLGGAAVALGVGGPVGARVVSFATLQVFKALVELNSHAGGSYDELLENALWLLTLAGPTGTWSWECRRRTGRWWSDAQVAVWPRLLVVYQVVLMYGSTGAQKLSHHWVPGGELSALYYILQQPTWQHADLRWVAWLYPATQVATLVSWLWEVSAPLWLLAVFGQLGQLPARWGERLGRWRVRDGYVVIGVVFHLGVAALLDIGSFTWASLALYPAFFGGAEWRRLTDVAPPANPR
jgi:hypothetical protein